MTYAENTRTAIDRYFAAKETVAHRLGSGGLEVELERQRAAFATTGHLPPDIVLQMRAWAVNRALAALHDQRPAEEIDEALQTYRLITRWAEDQSQGGGV